MHAIRGTEMQYQYTKINRKYLDLQEDLSRLHSPESKNVDYYLI